VTAAVLYAAENPDESIVFPFAPSLKAHDSSVKLTWSVARRGGISRPHGRQEKVFNFSITLPSYRDQDKPWVSNWRDPADIERQLQQWHAPIAKQGTRLRFVVNGDHRNIDATVYLSQVDVSHEGVGEYAVTLELTEWRVFTVRYDGESGDVAATDPDAAAGSNPIQQDPPSGPDTPDQYAVQDGDTLWAIAQTELGDGSRWQEIWSLNQGAETPSGGTFDDPDLIEIGMVLQLPSRVPGEADTNDPGGDNEVQ
jgi:LysM repeat protein